MSLLVFCVSGAERVLEKDVVQVEEGPPVLELLWTFTCDLTAGRNITCISWNKKNPVIITETRYPGSCDSSPILSSAVGSPGCGVRAVPLQGANIWTGVLLVSEESDRTIYFIYNCKKQS